jgi:gamma-glutamylcyclotransferase (GGCT)/AIG2-like uncharacterized protein YtfP
MKENGEKLFVYGSLMDPDIFFEVSGIKSTFNEAILKDFRVVRVLNEVYPGIYACPGFQVFGRVWTSLNQKALQRLDQFEGNDYERRQVQITYASGESESVWVYRFKEAFKDKLSEESWNFEEFLLRGVEHFRQNYMAEHLPEIK